MLKSGSERRTLVVLSGPSGVGKTTVCDELLKQPGFQRAITCTTRQRREGEVDGKDYYFLSHEEFERRVHEGDFLEHAKVHGNLYGVLWQEVLRAGDAGSYVLLAIDVQGAATLRRAQQASSSSTLGRFDIGSTKVITIFLLPPDEETLRQRLSGRATETDDQLKVRLTTAITEMEEKGKFDHVVVNEHVGLTVQAILGCI